LIAYFLVAVLGSGLAPSDSCISAVGDEIKSALPQDPSGQVAPEKKPKKAKPPPDEIDDPEGDVDLGEGGVHGVWVNHPSIRFGSVFRLDFKASLQEDAHASYSGAPGLRCPKETLPTTCGWQLHRNRVGIKGNATKKIDYEIERELTD